MSEKESSAHNKDQADKFFCMFVFICWVLLLASVFQTFYGASKVDGHWWGGALLVSGLIEAGTFIALILSYIASKVDMK